MKRFLFLAIIALGALVPAVAEAKVRTVVPQGNSGVWQYVETFPTVSGNRPTSSLHTHPGVAGAHNGGGTNGGTGASGSSTSSTQGRLGSQGAAGAQAAALAQATAPRGLGRGSEHGQATGLTTPATGAVQAKGEGASPVRSVADALTGSATSGGLGPLLPVILLVALVGSAAMAVLRRRGQS